MTASTIGGGLTQTGGTLAGSGTLTVTGLITWTSGTMSGSGVTNADGGLTIGGTSANTTYQEYLSARTLNNYAAATLAGAYNSGGLYFDSAATFNNEPGASFSITNDSQLWVYGGTTNGGTFNNQGTFLKAGGTGTSIVGHPEYGGSVAFNQSGTGSVEVQSGTLSFNGGGTLGGSGALTADSGATLGFGGGAFTVAASSGLFGASINFSGGTLNDQGSYDFTGTTFVTGGTVNFIAPVTSLGSAVTISAGTLNLSGGTPVSVGTMTQSGGTLTGSDTLTVTGQTTWTSGTMSGSGVTNADGGLTIGGTSANTTYQEYLSARTLNNYAAATLAGAYNSGGLYFDSAATFNNEPGASFSITNDSQLWVNGGTTNGGTFNNQGTFLKAGGTGTSIVGHPEYGGSVAFNQSGTGSVEVQSGTLSFNGGGTLGGSGALTADSGATLGFGGGAFTVAASSGLFGASINFSGGTLNDQGSYDFTGTTFVTGGTVNFIAPVTSLGSAVTISAGTLNLSGGTPVSVGTMTQSGGTLTGSDTLTVTGQTTWTSGTMSGSGVTNADGGLTIGGTSANTTYQEYLSARTLNNYAAATLAGAYNSGGLYFDSAATFNNEPGASFSITNDSQLWVYGGTTNGGTFNNQGTFLKAGGTGTSIVGHPEYGGSVAFNQSGTGSVEVQSGTLSFNGGGTLGGSGALTADSGATLGFGGGAFTVAASSGLFGASINFSGGTLNDQGSYDVTGTTFVTGGTVNFIAPVTSLGSAVTISAGTLNLSGGTPVSVGTMTQSGGTLTGPDTLTVTGETTWAGGYQSGAGTTVAEGGLTLGDQAGDQEILDQRTLETPAPPRWPATPPITAWPSWTAPRSTIWRRQLRFRHRRADLQQRRHPGWRHLRQRRHAFQDRRHGHQHYRRRNHAQQHRHNRRRIGHTQPQRRRRPGRQRRLDGRLGSDTRLWWRRFHRRRLLGSLRRLDQLQRRHPERPGVLRRHRHHLRHRRDRQLHRAGDKPWFGRNDLRGHAQPQRRHAGQRGHHDSIRWHSHRPGHAHRHRRNHLGRRLPVSAGTTVAEGGLTLGDQAGDQEILDQRTLENAGAATLAGYASNYGMAFLDGATFDNLAGASFAFVTDALISGNGGTPAGGTFVNAGTLSKTGGTGTSTIGSGITLNNTGTIDAESGTLSLAGGGTLGGSGALTADSGATLGFGGGTFTVAATSGIFGAGSANFSGGTTTDAGPYDIATATIVSGGTANLQGAIVDLGPSITASGGALNLTGSIAGGAYSLGGGIVISGGTVNLSTGAAFTTSQLMESGGNLTGPDTLTVTGLTTWAGGYQSGAGTTVAEGGLTLGDQAGDQEILDQRTLENAAPPRWPATPPITAWPSWTAPRSTTGRASFAFVTDALISGNGGTPAGGTFVNAGTLSKTGGTGTSTIGSGITLNNTGTIDAESGTLSLAGGGTLTGTIEATGGGSLTTTSAPSNLSGARSPAPPGLSGPAARCRSLRTSRRTPRPSSLTAPARCQQPGPAVHDRYRWEPGTHRR